MKSRSRSKSRKPVSRKSVTSKSRKPVSRKPRSRKPIRSRSRKASFKSVQKLGSGRGAGLRGWSKAKPTTKAERERVRSKCGARAFLYPSENKFPVCVAKPKVTCKLDCRGVVAAKIRGKHWGYPGVVSKANKLYDKYCRK